MQKRQKTEIPDTEISDMNSELDGIENKENNLENNKGESGYESNTSKEEKLDWDALYSMWKGEKQITEFPSDSKIQFLRDFNATQKSYPDANKDTFLQQMNSVDSLSSAELDTLTSRAWRTCERKV